MAKNNALINQYKEIGRQKKFFRDQVDEITPQIYAALAIALRRKHKWGYNRINDLFNESGRIWAECLETDINMIEMCEKETGIDVMNK